MALQTKKIVTVTLAFLVLLSGCGEASPSITFLPPTETSLPPTETDVPRTQTPIATPVLLTATDTPTPVLTSTLTPTSLPPLSASEGMIVFAAWEGFDWQIYTMSANGSGKRQVTRNVQGGYEPSWSPDGTKIIFQ